MSPVRATHHSTLASTASLMVPQMIIDDLELILPRIILQEIFLCQLYAPCFSHIIIGFIIELDGAITLLKEAIRMQRTVTGIANQLHFFATLFAIAQQRAHHIIRVTDLGAFGP